MPARMPFTPGNQSLGIPQFQVPEPKRGPLVGITGVTRDSGGAALGGCTVHLYRTATDVLVDTVVSDGSGNFAFPNVTPQDFHYEVAYKAGAPDVAGTSVNTLVGA